MFRLFFIISIYKGKTPMKSLLLEASTVEKAVSKAWHEAGKPKEFTIKVHDEGERNFLGFSRRDAALSILFIPQRSERDRRQSRDRGQRSSANRSRSSQGSQQKKQRKEAPATQAWSQEYEQFVVGNLREIVRLMGILVPFDIDKQEKVLTLTFHRDLMDDPEEQRMLFASLSYLSIQFLKRQFRNRFVGYRIVVASKGGTAKKSDKKSAKPRQSAKKVAEKQSPSQSQKPKAPARKKESKKTQPRRVAVSEQSDIAQEQNKFALQQLEFEQAQKAAAEVVVDEQKPAPQEKVEAKPVKQEEVVKKEKPAKQKYRAFYVLPEDDESA